MVIGKQIYVKIGFNLLFYYIFSNVAPNYVIEKKINNQLKQYFKLLNFFFFFKLVIVKPTTAFL